MTSTAYERLVDALHQAGSKVVPRGHAQASAQCPAHDDHNPSLALRAIEGQALVYCHAGCNTGDVLAALRLGPADLFDDPRGAAYRYTNATGDLTRTVLRTPDKKFTQRGNKTIKELYRLPQVIAAVAAGTTVYLVEGEKDVHALESLGVVATTAPEGAVNVDKVDVSPLKGATVVAIPDKDASGVKWSDVVRQRLDGYAGHLTLVEAKAGKDAADHVAAGYSIDDLIPTAAIGAEGTTEGDRPVRTVVAASAQGMTMRAPKWLYDRRMPTDAITLLAGREGIGKSTIAFDIVARVTRGKLPGRYEGRPRSVGVIASEDSWESVILPRLIAARADLTRVYRIEAKTEEGRLDTVSAPADLAEVARVCAEHDIALLVLDPIMSVIHGSLDTHKDREVRQALDPLARFCAEKEVAVLGLIHVNKSGTADPLNSIMASRAFTAVARSVLYCIVDPECEKEDRYLFGHPKSNLGPKQPTLKYRLIECKLEIENAEDPRDSVVVTSRVAWDGMDVRTIRDALEPVRERAAGEVAQHIAEWLAAHGRAASAGDIATAFPDVKRNTLDQNLARMVKRGTLVRPSHGLYACPPKPSDTQSDTSLETSETSCVSETSERLDQMTVLTEVTLSDVSEPVSEPAVSPSDWADKIYDRER